MTAVGGKEFDPLSGQRHPENTQSKVMSSFGLSNDGMLDGRKHYVEHITFVDLFVKHDDHNYDKYLMQCHH